MLGSAELSFNVDHGYLEGLVRGCKAGLLTQQDYLNLVQCETLEGELIPPGGVREGLPRAAGEGGSGSQPQPRAGLPPGPGPQGPELGPGGSSSPRSGSSA